MIRAASSASSMFFSRTDEVAEWWSHNSLGGVMIQAMSLSIRRQVVCLVALVFLCSVLATASQRNSPTSQSPKVSTSPHAKPPHGDDQGGDQPPDQPPFRDEIPPQSRATSWWWDIPLMLSTIAIWLVAFWLSKKADKLAEQKRSALEKKVETAPDKVKPAWELAQFTLERYFQRNLKQVNAIYWLSIAVMGAGFFVVVWGVRISIADPKGVTIGLIASASGILTEFISLTFMVIYRSTMSQANEYVSVLERINTVGMAMQILDSMAEGKSELKDTTRAQIIALLLSSSPAKGPAKSVEMKQGA